MKQIFYNNGKAYIVLRAIPHHNLVTRDGSVISELFNGWKEYLGADHVLRTSTDFLYCETIPDVEWEEVPVMEVENC
jgi:hypothetical protein